MQLYQARPCHEVTASVSQGCWRVTFLRGSSKVGQLVWAVGRSLGFSSPLCKLLEYHCNMSSHSLKQGVQGRQGRPFMAQPRRSFLSVPVGYKGQPIQCGREWHSGISIGDEDPRAILKTDNIAVHQRMSEHTFPSQTVQHESVVSDCITVPKL